ncbi:MAG TPA: hypothetical protein VGS80_03360 [Ktedonobacterales bacterium]|nr:hypothetical protein [Ktedonobacterales bacterium]
MERTREPHFDMHWIGHAYEWSNHLEAWRFFQSGQFEDIDGFDEDWLDQRQSIVPVPAGWVAGSVISVEDVIFRCAEIFEFAARLAGDVRYHVGARIHIEIALRQVKGRQIYIADTRKHGFSEPYQADVEEIDYAGDFTTDDLIGRPRDLAVERRTTSSSDSSGMRTGQRCVQPNNSCGVHSASRYCNAGRRRGCNMDTPFDTSFLVECPETEEAYCAWVQRFPQGFVINAWKVVSDKPEDARSMMWHRADCSHIHPKYACSKPPFRYVSGDTMKACSAHPAALAIWAQGRSEPLTYGKDCYYAWQKEQPTVP